MILINFEEAVRRLPGGHSIHTYREAGPIRLGATWDRERLLARLRTLPIHEAGPAAAERGYGLVVQDDQGLLFIQSVA